MPTPTSTQNWVDTDCAPIYLAQALSIAQWLYHELAQRHDPGWMDQLCPHYNALHWLLERSTGSGSSVAYPLFTMFCNRGDIMLPPMIPPPEQLTHPFTAATLQTDGFHQNVHRYNAALAFTLLGVEVRRASDILSPQQTLSSAWLPPSTRFSPSHTSMQAWYVVLQHDQFGTYKPF